MHAAAGAYAEQLFAAEAVNELMDIDGDGGHAHARALYRNGHAFVLTRVAQDIANGGVLLYIFQKVFCDEFSAQGVTGEQDAFCYVAFFCCNMRSCHVEFLLSLK